MSVFCLVSFLLHSTYHSLPTKLGIVFCLLFTLFCRQPLLCAISNVLTCFASPTPSSSSFVPPGLHSPMDYLYSDFHFRLCFVGKLRLTVAPVLPRKQKFCGWMTNRSCDSKKCATVKCGVENPWDAPYLCNPHCSPIWCIGMKENGSKALCPGVTLIVGK